MKKLKLLTVDCSLFPVACCLKSSKIFAANKIGLLYIFKDFFEGKAVEHLLEKGVKVEYLNYDRLGRVLDKIYEIG